MPAFPASGPEVKLPGGERGQYRSRLLECSRRAAHHGSQGALLRQGDAPGHRGITLVALAATVPLALAAVEQVAADGVSAEVLDALEQEVIPTTEKVVAAIRSLASY